ncbi:MAG: AAA-like domain-containing protein, partial [Cyanobacteria bacterium J06628_3]
MARSVNLRQDRQQRVHLLLHEQFISQQDFAEYAQVAASTVSNYVNCRPVDRIIFIKICEKLGVENWRDYADNSRHLNTNGHKSPKSVELTPSRVQNAVSNALEYPEGHVRVNSPFYIERTPIEQWCYEEITKPGALIRIKAPRQMGKSSLLVRTLYQAKERGDRVINLSLRKASASLFRDTNTFLKWFCASISRGLGLPANLDEYWELAEVMGGNLCCQDYFERYLLPEINQPITLALDEVDKVFEYPDISPDFFGLLRVIHEEAKQRTIWKQVRLVIAHSTEVYVPINLNQSPFNVGLPAELTDFTPEQILSLSQVYKLNWKEKQVLQLMEMVGGHPFLVRLALYYIARKDITLNKLLQTAPTTIGIYSTYLRNIESILENHPDLRAGMQELITNKEQAQLNNRTCSKLNALGLIKVVDGETIAT